MEKPRWSRVLLKLSGEAFAGEAGNGIDGDVVTRLATDIVNVKARFDVALAVVVGGGNIWRGLTGAGAGMASIAPSSIAMPAVAVGIAALARSIASPPPSPCSVLSRSGLASTRLWRP